MAVAAVRASLKGLADSVSLLEFGLLGDRQAEALARRDRLRRELEGHVARLEHLDAPLLVVVGGVTGGGKSTIVNTLAGAAVAPTGVRRPTTHTPTLLCHPGDVGWFRDGRVLPGLERREQSTKAGKSRRGRRERGGPAATAGAHDGLVLAPVAPVPAGLALLDAPDSDSISADNRALAGALLDAADVWLWVTTQGKYADEDSMALLRRARDRRTAIAVALTHLDAEQLQVVVDDCRGKLAAEGLPDVRLFAVPRCPITDEQLPEHALYDLRAWLWSAAGPASREALRNQTLQGALDRVPDEVAALLAEVDTEQDTYRALTAAARERYAQATAAFADLLEQGQISMREQVLRSWVSFIGTGRFQRFVQSAPDRIRQVGRRLITPLIDKEEQRLGEQLRVEAADAVTARVCQVADLAAGGVADDWVRDPAGRALLDERPGLHRSSPDLAERVAAAVTAWERDLADLVATKGTARKVRAQWASTAINATTASLMVAVFTATGGLTGAEVGIAGAGATLGQLVLEKMLGSQNVRWMIAEAKQGLLDHVGGVLDHERGRFDAAVAARAPDPDHRDAVASAVAAVAASRR